MGVAGSKSYKLPAACPAAGADAAVSQFTDNACATADTGTASVDVKTDASACAAVSGADIKIASCATMSCEGTNNQDLTCEAKATTAATTAANNTTAGASDNAMTASIAGAVLLSASA